MIKYFHELSTLEKTTKTLFLLFNIKKKTTNFKFSSFYYLIIINMPNKIYYIYIIRCMYMFYKNQKTNLIINND